MKGKNNYFTKLRGFINLQLWTNLLFGIATVGDSNILVVEAYVIETFNFCEVYAPYR